MATWHTLTTARAEWLDAPEGDAELGRLLAIGKQAVVAYAPHRDEIPDTWPYVQLQHARNVYRAMYTDQNGLDSIDGLDGGFGGPVRYRNLDASLRELLRPRTVFGGPVG